MTDPSAGSPQPTRTSYDVRSTITGAVVIADVPKRIADREAERLNGEARQVVGRRPRTITLPDEQGRPTEQPNPEGGRPVYAGEQRGRPTGYEVVKVDRADEAAVADALDAEVPRLQARRDELQARRSSLTAGERDRLDDDVRAIDHDLQLLPERAAELRKRRDDRRDAERAMLEAAP